MFRRVSAVVIVSIILAVGAGLVWKLQKQRDARFTTSCANHAIQHRFFLGILLSDQNGSVKFPFAKDTRSALLALNTLSSNSSPRAWFFENASACPESYLRDKSIGYLYLAEGIQFNETNKAKPLVLICPAENHQGSSQHCHAILADGDMDCLGSNAEMIDLLRDHFTKATEGTIPYSAEAQAILRREIAARERFETKRPKQKSRQTNVGGFEILNKR